MISDTCWKNILSDVFSIFLPSSEFVSEIEVCWKDDIKKKKFLQVLANY